MGLRVKQDSVTPGPPIPENAKDYMYQIGRAKQNQIKAEKAVEVETPAKNAPEAQMGN